MFVQEISAGAPRSRPKTTSPFRSAGQPGAVRFLQRHVREEPSGGRPGRENRTRARPPSWVSGVRPGKPGPRRRSPTTREIRPEKTPQASENPQFAEGNGARSKAAGLSNRHHRPARKWRRNPLKRRISRKEMAPLPRAGFARGGTKALQRVDRSIARSASAIVSGRPTWSHRPSSRTPKSRPWAAAA